MKNLVYVENGNIGPKPSFWQKMMKSRNLSQNPNFYPKLYRVRSIL